MWREKRVTGERMERMERVERVEGGKGGKVGLWDWWVVWMRAMVGYGRLTVGISRDWHDWRWLGGGVPGGFGRLCGIFEKL